MSYLASLLPYGMLLWLGKTLGYLWFFVVRIRRKVVLANLEKGLPYLGKGEQKKIALGCYCNLCMSAMEFLVLASPGRAGKIISRVDIHGRKILERELGRGKGVIVVSGHVGNWDLLAVTHAVAGFPVYVVTKALKKRGIDRFWHEARSRLGVNLLADKGSLASLFEVLKAGGILALVVDQHDPRPSASVVSFLGRKAAATSAPAVLALRTGAPVVPVFINRHNGDRNKSSGHVVTVHEPLNIPESGNFKQDVLELTQLIQQKVEQAVLENPPDWLWLHRRWKK
ncbi:MAG: lysophospholipid acyltransferase family protein [Deltaproteobacteria bacterium]|nr:lysophospholipid acyltransferase family protein [Deltaproteobacteria bacterium]